MSNKIAMLGAGSFFTDAVAAGLCRRRRAVAGTNSPIQHPETTSLLQETRFGWRAFSEVVRNTIEGITRLKGGGPRHRQPGAAHRGAGGWPADWCGPAVGGTPHTRPE